MGLLWGRGSARASHGEKGRKKHAFCLIINGGEQRDRAYTKSPVPRPTIVADVREWVISRARTQGRLGTKDQVDMLWKGGTQNSENRY